MPSAITLPNSAVEPTFENLLQISLQRQFSAPTFSQLYKDFKSKFESVSNEKFDSSPLFRCITRSHLQREYIFDVLVRSDIHSTSEEMSSLFNSTMTMLSHDDQKQVLLFINQFEKKFPWKQYASNNQTLNSFINYGKYLMSNIENLNTLDLQILQFYSRILVSVIQGLDSGKSEEEFIVFVTDFGKWILTKDLKTLHSYLEQHLSTYDLASIKSELDNGTKDLDAKHVKGNERDHLKRFRMKKIIWLAQKVTVEFCQLNEHFVTELKTLMNISNVSTMESFGTLTTELFTGMMDNYKLSSNNTKPIWREYIVNKLPIFLKFILKINQVKVEKCLSSIVTNEYKKSFANDSILAHLEKNLIELELMKPGILSSQNMSVTPVENSKKMSLDELNHNYTQKILECNPEFTSIEEIGMSDFLSEIAKSLQLKEKFAELFLESVNSFIMTGDTLRLRRLLITGCINFDILDHVVLQKSPYQVLDPLLKFLESRLLQKPESINMNSAHNYLNSSNQPELMMDLDIGGDDSSNAQDFLSDLSTIVVFSRFIITRCNLSMQNAKFQSLPNSLALINNHNIVINCNENKPVNVSEITIDDDIMNKWIKAMFDISNVDGISDNLIKESAPMEYAQLIPNIIYEAIVCYSIGWIDDDSLMSGLEYLHQKFLIGWIPFVIEKLRHVACATKEEKIVAAIMKVENQLLQASSTESLEVHVFIKMINSLFCKVETTEKQETSKIRLALPDIRHTLHGLVAFIAKNDSIPPQETLNIDLPEFWRILSLVPLPVESLFTELTYLLADNSLSAEFSYELITLLLVKYVKSNVGEGISVSWPKILSLVNNADSLAALLEKKLIFNKAPEPIEVISVPGKNDASGKITSTNKDTETDFFGLIQEPKSDNEQMEVDGDEKKLQQENNANNVIELDVYGDNLAVLAYERKGDPILDKFLRNILEHLD